MTTMNVSLPEELRAFVDEQVGARGYGSSSEYVRELIRRDQDKQALRALLLAGAASPLSAVVADAAYFDGLRERARAWADAAENVRRLDSTQATGQRSTAARRSRS